MQSYEIARKNMVDGQLRPNGVTHPLLLEAVGRLAREKFVPVPLRGFAYVDEDIEVGHGRYLPETMVLARLLQAAAVTSEDIVLDIACGTGYSTAVLGCLAATVVGVECESGMAAEAEKLLHEQDICNAVVIHQSDLSQGYAQQGPYGVILINGSVPEIPETVIAQLAEGGRLVAVLSEGGHTGAAVMLTKTGGQVSKRVLFDAAMPVLKGFQRQKSFAF